MTVRSRSWRLLLQAAIASLPIAACSVSSLDLSGKECPCVAGYVCDVATNHCVVPGTQADSGVVGTEASVPFDAPQGEAAADASIDRALSDVTSVDVSPKDVNASADAPAEAAPDAPSCNDSAIVCAQDADCCPNRQCGENGVCVAMCIPTGSSCTGAGICCVLQSCQGGACQACLLAGGHCMSSEQCCSGNCVCATEGDRCE